MRVTKIIALITSIMMCISFVGCKKQDEEHQDRPFKPSAKADGKEGQRKKIRRQKGGKEWAYHGMLTFKKLRKGVFS